MNHCKLFLRGIAALLLLLASSVAADAPTLTFKFTDFSFPGAAGTSVYGLNNSGVLVGQYYDSSGVFHGFKLDHGKGTTIDDPKGTDTLCTGINSSGAIVGQYTDPSGNNHGFLYQNGKFTDLSPEPLSGASGINDKGDIVGGMLECDFCKQHGYLYNGHTYKKLDVPGAMETGASSINNAGVITVTAPDDNGRYHSYLYRGGKYTEIKVPGAYETFAEQINNVGDIIFTWNSKADKYDHGALRHGGHFYKFNRAKNIDDTLMFGVNDHHLLVGDYIKVGVSGAFTATF
jgi:probable HAF family extracellular repeat protein